MNGIPRFERDPDAADPDQARCCRPYLQIFKNAKLIYASLGKGSASLRWYSPADGSILFPVGLDLEGDILIRVRHLAKDNKRVSMLRFGFHTGYIQPGNSRFARADIDGAYADERFDRDFLMDLIFVPAVDADGTALTGSVDASYWPQAAKRPEPRPKAGPDSGAGLGVAGTATATTPGRFALFDAETSAERKSARKDDRESFRELEAYVQGLHNLESSELDLDVDSDTDAEIVFQELSRELRDDPDYDEDLVSDKTVASARAKSDKTSKAKSETKLAYLPVAQPVAKPAKVAPAQAQAQDQGQAQGRAGLTAQAHPPIAVKALTPPASDTDAHNADDDDDDILASLDAELDEVERAGLDLTALDSELEAELALVDVGPVGGGGSGGGDAAADAEERSLMAALEDELASVTAHDTASASSSGSGSRSTPSLLEKEPFDLA